MILIRAELHSARTGKTEEIGRLQIVNDGTGDARRGNYTVRLTQRGHPGNILREAKVKNHARTTLPIWSLVLKCLVALSFPGTKRAKPADEEHQAWTLSGGEEPVE